MTIQLLAATTAMTLAKTAQNQLQLDHDSTSKIPSKSSQPPIAKAETKMAPPEVPMAVKHGGMWDHDTQVYYMKRYRTQLASAPASFLSVFVGVRARHTSVIAIANPTSVSFRKSEDEDAIVRMRRNSQGYFQC